MKNIKRFSIAVTIAIMTAVLSVTTMMSAGAVYYFNGETMITDTNYKYYRAWSQDQYPWHNTKPSDAWEYDWMNRYGCSTVAMAKMFVEAGVANPKTVNPGTLMTKYGTPTLGIGDIGIYWSNLCSHFGVTCESFQYYPKGSFYDTAMSFFNRTDHNYHLLMKVTLSHGGPHYVQVDRQATIDSGHIVFNDSTNTSDGSTRFNSKEDYWNDCALKTVTQRGFSPNFFVVFYNDDTLKLRKVQEVNSTTAKISWYPNGCCQKYIVYRREKGEKTWTGKRLAKVNHIKGEGIRAYTDKTLKMGKTYEYTVRGCYNVKGKDNFIKYDKKGISITTHPDPPVLVSAKSKNMTSINVKWKEVNKADGYKVYRKEEGQIFKGIATVKKTTSYTDTTAKCGIKYIYTVRAYKGKTDFLGQYDKNGVSAIAVPDAPELTESESVDFSTIKVKWKKIKGVSGYCIYRKGTTDKVYQRIGTINDSKITEYSDLSAITGQKYLYTVRAFKKVKNNNVLGNYEEGITGTAYPNPPAFKGYSSTSSDNLTIRWEKVMGTSGYIVYRKDEGEKTYKKLSVIDGNGNLSYTDKKLKAGKEYLYKIKSYRTVFGKKIKGYAGDACSAFTRPAQPGLKSTKSLEYNTIRIKWTKVTGASGYSVYKKINGQKYKKLDDVEGNNSLSYKDKTAVSGQKYTYTVRAYSDNKKGRVYSTYKNYIYGTAYPKATEISDITSLGYNSIEVNWKKVDGATGYEIYRKKEESKKYSSKPYAEVSGKTLSYIDTSAKCGQPYEYVIKTIRNYNGKETTSALSKSAVCKAVTIAPVVKVSRKDYKSLTVSWTLVSGANVYKVYYKNSSSDKWKKLATFNSSTLTSCVHSGLTTGKKYYYTVKGGCKSGKTTIWGKNNKKGVYTTPVTVAPTLVSASCTDYKTIEFDWKKVDGASGYRIYRKSEEDTKWVSMGKVSNKVTSYEDKNATCGEKYRYTVRAYRNVDGKEILGLYSSSGISALSIPEKPLLAAVSSNYNKIKLNWNYCYGATGYKIYRKMAGGNYNFYMRVSSASTTTITDTVECGVEYSYYITAYKLVDKVEIGSYDSAVRSCKAVPATPKLVSVTSNSKGTATISWDTVSGASGYYIYMKESGSSSYKEIYNATSGSTKSFTELNLESGKKYKFTVIAYRICTAGYISGTYNKTGLSVTVK